MQETHRAVRTDGAAGRTALPRIVLEIARGRAKHKSRPVRSTAFLIGTAPDCDLVLADPQFDTVHSYLLVQPTRVTIRHLGAGPPLRVDGCEVAWRELDDRSRLQMGSYEFQVRIEWPESITDRSAGNAAAAQPEHPYDDTTERQSREVAQIASPPRLSVFVGDDPQAPGRQPQPLSASDPGMWRQSRQASY